jgi:chromosome segregation ATPase/N-acetylneuraminic acid mutarotase
VCATVAYIYQTPQPLFTQQQSQTGRQSPGPGPDPGAGPNPGYPTVGMGLPSQMDRTAPQQQMPPQNDIMSNSMPSGAGYPWSVRRVLLPQNNGNGPSLSPFPRYGFSVPSYPSHSGHILLFGGLVRDRAHNDLWSLDVRDSSLQQVKTRGDAPLPRIGHISVIADRIMLVFGGDTKIIDDDEQDKALYVLDLRTQEWTQFLPRDGPTGRYGHAACLVNGFLYVHGGHVDGRNLEDLWSFDIRQVGGDPALAKWERVPYSTPAPLARTGHTLVPFENKLYLFGGTDGDYHYNDSWSFDLATGAWTELECIGYIPIPREGHAAAIVNGVVYVFGGRDVHGKDLGDLAAFRISNQRWYMFQNMGPAPMAKSGHSLCTAHGKVFVIGGESNQPQQTRDDPDVIHVLDTTKIKYPTDPNGPRARQRTASDATDLRAQPYSPPNGTQFGGTRSVENLNNRSMSPANAMMEPPRPLIVANDTSSNSTPTPGHIPRSESIDASRGLNSSTNRPANGVPPQRPKRDDDEEYRRAMSPSTHTNGTDASTPPADRIITPNGPTPTNGPTIRMSGPDSPTVPSHTIHPNQRTSRSPPPQLRLGENGERPALPPDAYYFSGKSPTTSSRPGSMNNGRPTSMLNPRPGSIVGRPGSIVGRPGSIHGADLMRELKARETEADNAKRREAALRVVLARAIEQGFVVDDEDEVEVPEPETLDNEGVRKIAEALVQLKEDKATLQNEVAIQIKIANDKIQEADRLQKSALHEAAYYRAKAVALETGTGSDVKRLETERISELEQLLESQTVEYEKNKVDLERVQGDVTRHADMSKYATERELETLKRAEEAEEKHAVLLDRVTELEQEVSGHTKTTREQSETLITHGSTIQQGEAERDTYRTQLDEALATHTEHLTIIEQTQASLNASGARVIELESLHLVGQERITSLEAELLEARRALEDKTREAEQAQTRLAEAETLHTTTREEAASLRSLNTGSLAELLTRHRDNHEAGERSIKGHQEQLRALEEEKSSLLKLLREAGTRVDSTEAAASEHRQTARGLEASHQTLQAELRTMRTRLLNTQSEMTKYSALYATKDDELRERDHTVTQLQTRVSLLRKIMGDHDIVVTDSELENAELPSTSQLEDRLRDKTRAHENAQREIEELTERLRQAEDQADSLGKRNERITNRSGSSASMRSLSPNSHSALEVQLARKEEELSVIRTDYQTAVRYVKGTEKMLKRMKEELEKQKQTNKQQSAELDQLRGGRSATGRSTPSDGDMSRRVTTLNQQMQNLEAALNGSKAEVEMLRQRLDEEVRGNEVLREQVVQNEQRIQTLLSDQVYGIDDADDKDQRTALRRHSSASSTTSMAFDKVS